MLKLDGVNTAYDGVPVLQSVDLQVEMGEIVTLLGPNGAGKTTTFRAVTGIVKPTTGKVIVNGYDTRKWSVSRIARLGFGVVPEGRRLMPKLTVRDNLRLGFQLSTQSVDFTEALSPILESFPRIGERLKQKAGTLSGGEQAMVALARALISRPKYLIMDEPSLGLAPNMVDEYFDMVARQRNPDTAILLIEQNLTKSLAIADRAYMLKKGEVIFSGTSDELRDSDVVSHVYLGKPEERASRNP